MDEPVTIPQMHQIELVRTLPINAEVCGCRLHTILLQRSG